MDSGLSGHISGLSGTVIHPSLPGTRLGAGCPERSRTVLLSLGKYLLPPALERGCEPFSVPEPVSWEGRVGFLTGDPGPSFEELCESACSVDHTVAHNWLFFWVGEGP